MATAKYPYAEFRCNSAFAQVAALLQNPPPQLSSDDFHISTVDFVERCLQKVPSNRPDYPFLLNHPFIKIHQDFDSSLMKQEVSEWAKESLSWYQKSQEM
ncbi:hypothetical protein HMI55_005331 [Coelomomyces lativittatus]|nr:hypothetical protein HMI55_005331 [Coelomomyces lativittatus]